MQAEQKGDLHTATRSQEAGLVLKMTQINHKHEQLHRMLIIKSRLHTLFLFFTKVAFFFPTELFYFLLCLFYQ